MKKLLVSMVIVIGSSVSFAAIDNVVVVKKAREVVEDSSEFHRMNKESSILLNVLGVGPGAIANTGIGFAKHITLDQLVIFEVRTGSVVDKQQVTSFQEQGTYRGESNTKFDSLGVHYKQFAGNSFYFRTGLDFNTYSYSFSSNNDSKFQEYLNKFKANAWIANFTIGNQWQWEKFTLGCDWIGYAVPISSQVTSQRLSPMATASSIDYLNDFKKELFEGPSIIGLRLYLGASF